MVFFSFNYVPLNTCKMITDFQKKNKKAYKIIYLKNVVYVFVSN